MRLDSSASVSLLYRHPKEGGAKLLARADRESVCVSCRLARSTEIACVIADFAHAPADKLQAMTFVSAHAQTLSRCLLFMFIVYCLKDNFSQNVVTVRTFSKTLCGSVETKTKWTIIKTKNTQQ